MAGKSKGARNKAKAQGGSQAAVAAEPEVPVTDGVEDAKPEIEEVSEPAVVEGSDTGAEKEQGDAAGVTQAAKKPAEGNGLPHSIVFIY